MDRVHRRKKEPPPPLPKFWSVRRGSREKRIRHAAVKRGNEKDTYQFWPGLLTTAAFAPCLRQRAKEGGGSHRDRAYVDSDAYRCRSPRNERPTIPFQFWLPIQDSLWTEITRQMCFILLKWGGVLIWTPLAVRCSLS